MNKKQKEMLKLVYDDLFTINQKDLDGDNLIYYLLVRGNLKDLLLELNINLIDN